MVFPQGVFSSASAEALKRNGYLAAANTETSPVDSEGEGTRVRDVWDVAILKYGDFPIFSRRYAKHGLENFAFDLLLGKPCLIVAHHDFFSDDCTRLIELIEKLESLPCTLTWRPLGEVIRRACRRRAAGAGKEAIEMYGSELLIDNSFEQAIDVHILKRENEADIVAEVLCDQKPIMWKAGGGHLVFEATVAPRSERLIRVLYQNQDELVRVERRLRIELAVAIRRLLSEARDEYFSRNRFLNRAASKMKNLLTKTN